MVYIVWGLKHRDVSGCHFSDEQCEGVQRYDDSFNPNTPVAQVALMVTYSIVFNIQDMDKINTSSVTEHVQEQSLYYALHYNENMLHLP